MGSERNSPEAREGQDDNVLSALDRRLTILETRFDTILPTLATKADLAELRAELKADIAQLRAELKADMHAESGRLTRWMGMLTITMLIGFGGMILTLFSLLPP